MVISFIYFFPFVLQILLFSFRLYHHFSFRPSPSPNPVRLPNPSSSSPSSTFISFSAYSTQSFFSSSLFSLFFLLSLSPPLFVYFCLSLLLMTTFPFLLHVSFPLFLLFSPSSFPSSLSCYSSCFFSILLTLLVPPPSLPTAFSPHHRLPAPFPSLTSPPPPLSHLPPTHHLCYFRLRTPARK